ncbi:MAG TPA: hypothetical protein PLA50_11130, partial [Bacteroidia bacterium]|nr:hypothetical protein [Bacteroidia bacterium]
EPSRSPEAFKPGGKESPPRLLGRGNWKNQLQEASLSSPWQSSWPRPADPMDVAPAGIETS